MSVHIELEAGDRSGRVMVGVDGVEVEGGLVRGGRVFGRWGVGREVVLGLVMGRGAELGKEKGRRSG